jgi:hypothetical protein
LTLVVFTTSALKKKSERKFPPGKLASGFRDSAVGIGPRDGSWCFPEPLARRNFPGIAMACFHIRWGDSKLDWECHGTPEDAELAAIELSRQGEVFSVEKCDDGQRGTRCPSENMKKQSQAIQRQLSKEKFSG